MQQEGPVEAALANVKNQSVGPGTLGELGMSESYLRRVAESVTRESFEDHYRIVVESEAHAPGAHQEHQSPENQPQGGVSVAMIVTGAIVLLLAGLFVLRRRGA